MRRATNSTMWLLSDNGAVEGLSLGSDYCSEHEWGIAGLREAFGTPSKFENGLEDRVAKQQPPVVLFEEYKLSDGTPAACLVFGSANSNQMNGPAISDYIKQEASFHTYISDRDPEKGNLVCAWDDKGACVHVRTAEQVQRLKDFKQAIERQDIAFGGDLLDRDRYSNAGGLIFVVPSKVNPDLVQAAYEKDRKAVRLREAAAKIGLDQELRASGKRWFALSPRWKDKEESEVVYWLNPMDQQDYHAGQFTAAQLREWAQDKGPVMIDKPLKALNEKYSDQLQKIRRRMDKQGLDAPSLTIEWKNDNKTEFGVRAHYIFAPNPKKPQPRFPEGLHELSDLEQQFPKPPPVPRKPKSDQPAPAARKSRKP